jgi:Histidine kinase-, DNA gyrase B-, and HSP90-like ATPase
LSNATLRFQVDSRLATLLSQEYSSTERALKELVDNAWDADASRVEITLPQLLSNDPIVVSDDGSGMTEQELRSHYLFIASDRRSRRGERTAGRNRLIKGRKGIGKFSGLMAASVMSLDTRARGVLCGFTLRLADFEKVEDIEQLDIEIRRENCEKNAHGTEIKLRDLHQRLEFPDPTKLRQLLLQDYGRHDDFQIFVNTKQLGIDDVSGGYSESDSDLPHLGLVRLRFSISDGKAGLRQPGITLRVDGKAVGKPSFFGLDELDDFPPKLLRKVFGEVQANGLRDHITAGWDAPIENSELLKQLQAHVQPILRQAFRDQYGREMQLAQVRLSREIQGRLSKLPDHKRIFAERGIKKILERFYQEPESKIEPIVNVILDALEQSDYRILLEHIAGSKPRDISAIADGLSDFGLADMASLVEQARARVSFLDQLEKLRLEPSTSEAMMHRALENNLWVFGPEYSLFSSNTTLRRQIKDQLDKRYVGPNADHRPDLLLNENLSGEYLLIEFKKPNHPLNHADYVQALSYRNDLRRSITQRIRVLVVGGARSPDFPSVNREPDVDAVLFDQLISTARRQLQWLLRDLS